MPSDKLSGLLIHPDPNQTPDALPEAPPAPPPIQPVTATHNPYSFITDTSKPVKKSLLPKSNNKMGRIFIALGGATGLIVLVLIILSFLGRSSASVKADYTNLAQQQSELINLSTVGVTKARQPETRFLAVTTQYTLTSQQPDVLTLVKKTGAKINTRTLALSRDAQADKALTSAEQSNQFDQVFVQTLNTKLSQYQQSLKKLYDASSSASTKAILSKDYDAVSKLLKAEPKNLNQR